ncbi:TetR/AcrR family transcriptional regulator [Rhizobium halophytocola]|uniref:AcrR family transcriptional regulator n=1 Tax=Rhizobium halophytocola TaxID=735519 RepID=A0ABS4DTM4_9HYPH|nr:TetR/AcrR family transcriptional regulator [Rhizobium halophytocola]MBP1849022.1 AcrR family transcriptional regulator [Rhizobium halophytocola]
MTEKLKDKTEECAAVANVRFAAGEDPAKREQILDGAQRVFLREGFDAASMNDVTREAGVSKGTIYVYFSNKEDLFAALIERQKGRFTTVLRDVLHDSKTVEEGLTRFAHAFVHQIVGTDMILAMRTVLGVIDRMPGVCRGFLTSSPINARTVLIDFIKLHVEEGNLSVDDPDMAARQFIDISTATYFKMKLFNELPKAPTQKETNYVVECAVKVFMKAYGKEHA